MLGLSWNNIILVFTFTYGCCLEKFTNLTVIFENDKIKNETTFKLHIYLQKLQLQLQVFLNICYYGRFDLRQ